MRLLDAGATVRAAVGHPDDADTIGYLNSAAAKAPGTIRCFGSNLLKEGFYAEATAGCSIALHTASPFKLTMRRAARSS
ncbi:MAG: hypothetical protein OEZ06_01895 [Myxococcales bacterium]|nr:hypothetical protein [Myxococcales bacterium]